LLRRPSLSGTVSVGEDVGAMAPHHQPHLTI